MEVLKTHGSSNDIHIIAGRPGEIDAPDLPRFIRQLCDRSGPFGADGVYFIAEDGPIPEAFFYNSDGNAGKLCGNGLRTVARWLLERREEEALEVMISGVSYRVQTWPNTRHGVKQTKLTLPPVSFAVSDLPMKWAEATCITQSIPVLHEHLQFTAVAVPNPHLVALTQGYNHKDLMRLGSRVAQAHVLLPDGANVTLLQPITRNEFFCETFERGAGLTLSCGSAVVAARSVYSKLGFCSPEESVVVRNPGGAAASELQQGESGTWIPTLTGNASYVYKTQIDTTVAFGQGFYEMEAYLDEIMSFATEQAENDARLSDLGIRVK